MKPLSTVIIISSIIIVFLLWNRRKLFSPKPHHKSKSLAVTQDETETTILLSELLSLNRAGHVLSRSGSLIDKLLKMEKSKACEIVMRDYDLSSLMILIKHEEHEKVKQAKVEGFKRISELKEEKKVKELSISKPDTPNTPDKSDHEDNHHTTNDPLRIALYCKNLLRPPMIGRVVRMVESEVDKDDEYIIELIK